MLPVQLDTSRLAIAVVGRGGAAARKVKTALGAGAARLVVYSDAPGPALAAAAGERLAPRLPGNAELAAADLVLVAGLPEPVERELAARCRALKVLVNVEDRPDCCDVHLPAVLRRGDLTLAISTNGRAPGLAGLLRRYLERLFGPEWQDRVEELSGARASWRAEGADMATVKHRTGRYVEDRRWLI
jgi:precorrin-2 dehydrogenase/sirohydrochlorin ferrochelatase